MRTSLKPRTVIIILLIGVCTGAVFFGVLRLLKTARPLKAYGCVASIHDALQKSQYLSTSSVVILTNDWRILTEAGYDRAISDLSGSFYIDAGKGGWLSNKILVDPWKRRYQIAVRRIAQNTMEQVVWSNGPDGISGTIDDIVSPQGSQHP
jgi:hypothetical protein